MRLTRHPLGPDHKDLPRISLDAAAAARLCASFDLLASQPADFAATFYGDLFTAQPEWRSLFPDDIVKQQKKLIDTLEWVVRHLDKPEQLRAAVRELGERHVNYGAKPAHYPIVCDILVRAMARTAGAKWTTEQDQDWRIALSRLSDFMLGRA